MVKKYVKNIGGTSQIVDLVETADIGTAAALDVGDIFQVSNNLSEGVAATKRTNLGLSYGLQTIWVPAGGMIGYVGAAPGQNHIQQWKLQCHYI
jgi:hypothetical protein